MSSFLEQYGVAIFVILIIGILVLMASPIGTLIKNAIMDKINNLKEVEAPVV